LNKSAASGVDELTVEAYQENLESNLADLVERLKKNDIVIIIVDDEMDAPF